MKLPRKIKTELICFKFAQVLLSLGIFLTFAGLLAVPYIHTEVKRNYKEFFVTGGIVSVSLSIILNIIGILKVRKNKK
ncbi:MAG: hypothetical protein ACEPO8_12605 [Rhodothermaceae bacterium]